MQHSAHWRNIVCISKLAFVIETPKEHHLKYKYLTTFSSQNVLEKLCLLPGMFVWLSYALPGNCFAYSGQISIEHKVNIFLIVQLTYKSHQILVTTHTCKEIKPYMCIYVCNKMECHGEQILNTWRKEDAKRHGRSWHQILKSISN